MIRSSSQSLSSSFWTASNVRIMLWRHSIGYTLKSVRNNRKLLASLWCHFHKCKPWKYYSKKGLLGIITIQHIRCCLFHLVNIIWRSPWNKGVSMDFITIFEVNRNLLKFGMQILFMSTDVPMFFFKQGEKSRQKCPWKLPPLSLSPSPQNKKTTLWWTPNCSKRVRTLYDIGGGDSYAHVSRLLLLVGKQTTWYLFCIKSFGMPNFSSLFWVTSKVAVKSILMPLLHGPLHLLWLCRTSTLSSSMAALFSLGFLLLQTKKWTHMLVF